MQNLFCYEKEEEEEEEEEEVELLAFRRNREGEISAGPELKATASIYYVKKVNDT